MATTIICAIVSVASGSSWATIATVGTALLGVGTALGFSEAITAGAIISGAYFGDKMSPLSDTTNLAAAMAKTDLYTHIRYMALTTMPSFGLNIIIFLGIGIFYDTSRSAIEIEGLIGTLESNFNTSPILFLVPAIVVFLIIKKVKPWNMNYPVKVTENNAPRIYKMSLQMLIYMNLLISIIATPTIIETILQAHEINLGFKISSLSIIIVAIVTLLPLYYIFKMFKIPK